MENFKTFSMNDIFIIGHGFYNKKPPCHEDGNIPFIGASAINNGVTGFTTIEEIKANSKTGNLPNEPLERKLFSHGTLVVVNNGNPGYTYYQPSQYTSTHDVNPLTLRDYQLSEDLAMYLIPMIQAQGVCFEYARKWRPIRMIRSQFLLPVTKEGKPNWDYMSNHVRSIRKELLQRYKKHINKQLIELEYKEVPRLSDINWDSYYVSCVFNKIERGKRLKKADQISGNTPYVSSTSMNNGVDGFITATPGTRVFSDCISLANSGSVGSAFYEPFKFVASDHVTHLKRQGLSKWAYLFLTTVLEKQKGNFNFNREINDDRINKMQIILPVNANGEPDYEYMEQYAKNIMYKKYKQYLSYLEKKYGDLLD